MELQQMGFKLQVNEPASDLYLSSFLRDLGVVVRTAQVA